ncbi:MAG: heme exporter protein CcmB [Bryobacteraceae bacterium]
MSGLSYALAIARKDLAIEFRTKESLNAAGAFSIVILLLFSFAFDPASDTITEMAGGLLWLVFAFAGALIFNRGFARELPNECLDALMASPVPAASLLVGKAITSLVLLIIVEFVSLFVFGIFYNMNWWKHGLELFVVLVMTTWGISIVGAVFGALTVNLRLRELMLPVLIYPLLIPLLMAAIELTSALLNNEPLTPEVLIWGRVLLVFDIVFTGLSVLLAEAILLN